MFSFCVYRIPNIHVNMEGKNTSTTWLLSYKMSKFYILGNNWLDVFHFYLDISCHPDMSWMCVCNSSHNLISEKHRDCWWIVFKLSNHNNITFLNFKNKLIYCLTQPHWPSTMLPQAVTLGSTRGWNKPLRGALPWLTRRQKAQFTFLQDDQGSGFPSLLLYCPQRNISNSVPIYPTHCFQHNVESQYCFQICILHNYQNSLKKLKVLKSVIKIPICTVAVLSNFTEQLAFF